MSDVAARHFWKARDIVDGNKDRANLESAIAHAIAHAIADGYRAGIEAAAQSLENDIKGRVERDEKDG